MRSKQFRKRERENTHKMSDRFACAVDKCSTHYAQKSSLIRHQRKQHAQSYEENGLLMRRVSGTSKRQKTGAASPDLEAIFEEPPLHDHNHNHDHEKDEMIQQQALVIESMQQRIAALEGQFSSLGDTLHSAGQHAARSATQAVEAVVDARCSELYAHFLDLKEQQTLLAKKTTKWCVVCFSKENAYAFMPCRHKCVCRDCAKEVYQRYKKCPICREPVTSAKAIYDLSAMETN